MNVEQEADSAREQIAAKARAAGLTELESQIAAQFLGGYPPPAPLHCYPQSIRLFVGEEREIAEQQARYEMETKR